MRLRALFVSVAIGLLFAGSLSAQSLGAVLTPGQETRRAPSQDSGTPR
jgi:hypothetical protein